MTITKNGLLSSLGFSSFEEVGNKLTGYQLNKMLKEYAQSFTNDEISTALVNNGDNLIYNVECFDSEDIINIDLGVKVLAFKFGNATETGATEATISFTNTTGVSLNAGSLILVQGVQGYDDNDAVDNFCDLILEVVSTSTTDTTETISVKAYSYKGNTLTIPKVQKNNKFFVFKLVK